MTVIVMIRLAVPQFSSVVTAGEKVESQSARDLHGDIYERMLLL